MRWNDRLCLRNNQRRPTKTITSEHLLSEDVIELKQAALWRGERQFISRANDASVEGIVTLLRWSRSRLKPRKLPNLSQPSEFATKQLSLPAFACLSSPSHTAQAELCEDSDSGHAGDPIVCGCNLKDPVIPPTRSREERVVFRWRRFLLLTYLVVTASTAQLCLMTQDEKRERKLREAQETRERLRTVAREAKQNVGKNHSKKIPQTLTPATAKGELQPSKRPPKGSWPVRLSDCPHVIESRAFRENPHLEWMTCLRCGTRWSRTTGRHSNEEGSGCDTAPLYASMSRLWKAIRFQQTSEKKEMFFRCSRFPLRRRVVRVPPTTG